MRDISYKFSQEQTAMLSRYVEEYFSLDQYNTIMDKLRELKAYGNDNSYWYGDADVYVYIETIDKVECVVINNVVSCFDRPVCVIKVTDMGEVCSEVSFNQYSIKAICTINKSEKSKYEWTFGDRRDYEVVGVDLIKQNGFGYLYQDERDIEWAFNTTLLKSHGTYENLTRDNTLFILQEMDYLFDNLNNLNKD